MPSAKRTELLDAAEQLFATHGFGAVGIQQVLQEAGVARRTLYLQFGSKQDLVVAVLERLDRRWRERTTAYVNQEATTARGRLTAVFAALRDDVERPDFPGCVFARAAAEYGPARSRGDDLHPARAAAVAHQAWVRDWLTRLADEAGVDQPRTLALQLGTLFDGTMACAQVKPCPQALDAAIDAAEMLIDAGLAAAAL